MPIGLLGLLLMVIGGMAQSRVMAIVARYSKQKPQCGLTGEQAAREILDRHGLHTVPIEETQWGLLTDHYDPTKGVLRLSKTVGPVSSIAAVGIAAHEAGHAIQHAESYQPLMMRTSLAQPLAIGTRIVPYIFWGGFILSMTPYRSLGVPLTFLGGIIFMGITAMSVITLPVEFDASNRARKYLRQYNIVSRDEMTGVNAVLQSAAWTYVVGALSSLIRMLLRRGR
jgi:Zn-dependent membrane protease YugP